MTPMSTSRSLLALLLAGALLSAVPLLMGPASLSSPLLWLATLLLPAFVLGQLIASRQLPATTGHALGGLFLAGLAFSPGKLIPPQGVRELFDAVAPMALAATGLLLAGQLTRERLRGQGVTMVRVWGMLIVGIFPALTIATLLILRLSQQSASAQKGVTAMALLAPELLVPALLVGLFAASVSPSLVSAVLHGVPKVDARLATITQGSATLTHLTIVALLVIWGAPTAPGLKLLLWLLATAGLGGAMGGALGLLYRLMPRRALGGGALLVVAAGPLAALIQADVILAALIAGVIVHGLWGYGERLETELRWLAPPLLLFFVAWQLGALAPELFLLGPLILTLALLRATLLVWGARWVTLDLQADHPPLARLGACLIPQGPELLPLALLLLAGPMPDEGAQALRLIIPGMVALSWLLGSALLHAEVALPSADEAPPRATRAAPRRGASRQGARALARATIAWPSAIALSDRWLAGRADELRRELLSQYEALVSEALEPGRDSWLRLVDGTLEACEAHLDAPTSSAQLSLLRRAREAQQASAPLLSSARLAQLWAALERAETGASVFRVELEPRFFEAPPQATLRQQLRALTRRLRRRVSGPIWRAVPLGELWVYHVVLAMPGLIASQGGSIAAEEAALWCELRLHAHRMSALAEPGLEAPAREARRALLRAEAQQLRGRIMRLSAAVEHALASAAARCLDDFQQALLSAGTPEHARPVKVSRRVDSAFRARRTLALRQERLGRVIDGYRGWLLMEQEAAQLDGWLSQFERQALTRWDELFYQPLRAALEVAPDPELSPLEQHHHHMRRLDTTLRAALAAGARELSAPLTARLQARVEQLPTRVLLHARRPSEPPASSLEADLREVSPRAWFRAQLAQTLDLRLNELEARAVMMLRDTQHEIARVCRVLEFHTSSASATDATLQEAALERAQAALAQLTQRLEREREFLHEHLPRDFDKLRQEAIAPIRNTQIAGMTRATVRQEASRLQRAARSSQTFQRLDDAREAVLPTLSFLLQAGRHALADDDAPTPPALLRAAPLARRTEQAHPAQRLYERLFTTAQLDVSDFYVRRARAEAQLLEASARWRAGEPLAIVVHGAHGAGKRAVLHHLLQSDQLAADAESHLLTLPDMRADEPSLLQTLGAVMAPRPGETMEAWGQRVLMSETRRVVVLERAHRLIWRAPDGFAFAQRALSMMHATRRAVLWVLVIPDDALRLMDLATPLAPSFGARVPITPMSQGELVQLIERRHNLSALKLRFARPEHTPLQRLAHPLLQLRHRRDPRLLYFEQLRQRSQGNPTLAMRLWFHDARLEQDGSGIIATEPMPEPQTQRARWWQQLTAPQRLLLIELMRHGATRQDRLDALLDLEPTTLHAALSGLLGLGLVSTTFSASMTSYQLSDGLRPLIAQQLNALGYTAHPVTSP